MNTLNKNDKRDIITLIDQFYQLLSGSSSDERDWSKFSQLFIKHATLSYIRKQLCNEVVTLNISSYISRLSKVLSNQDFWESGADYQVCVSNHIASVISTYHASSDRQFLTTIKSGKNFILLTKIQHSWKISSMLWEDYTYG